MPPEEKKKKSVRAVRAKPVRHAAGEQLVQATDQYVGARNATIVLHDNDGVRATMTAHWLLQMGWKETYVLDHAPAPSELTTEAEPRYPAGFSVPRSLP